MVGDHACIRAHNRIYHINILRIHAHRYRNRVANFFLCTQSIVPKFMDYVCVREHCRQVNDEAAAAEKEDETAKLKKKTERKPNILALHFIE